MDDDGGEVERGAGGERPAWLARCPECGYDLAGTDLDEKPCPECGWKATAGEIKKLGARWRFERDGAWLGAGVLAIVAAYIAVIELLAQARAGSDAIGVAVGLFRAEFVLLIGLVLGSLSALVTPRGERSVSLVAWCQTVAWLMLPFVVTFPLVRLFWGPVLQPVPAISLLLGLVAVAVWVGHFMWLTERHVIELGMGALAFIVSALMIVLLSLWPAAAVQLEIWGSV